ncbi:hypothetical protein Tco_1083283, partial [Tanacetum coccineum]
VFWLASSSCCVSCVSEASATNPGPQITFVFLLRQSSPLIHLGLREIASVALKQVSGSGFRVRTGFRSVWVKEWGVTRDGGAF